MPSWAGDFPDFAARNAYFKERPELKVPGARIYVDRNNATEPHAVVQDWIDGAGWQTLDAPIPSMSKPPERPGAIPDPAPEAPKPLVFVLPDREVRHKAGKSGSGKDSEGPYGLIVNTELPWELEEAWLDLLMWFAPNFDWDHNKSSGKIYGLSSIGDTRLPPSQNGTGNCSPIKPEAWSTRSTFKTGGKFELYCYHQQRPGECGNKMPWSGPAVPKDREVRYTERVKINTPGVADGQVQIWIDGKEVFNRTDLMLRGVPTDPTMPAKSARALIGLVKEHNYFGGSDESGPRWDCDARFRCARVQNFAPDFSIPLS
jgi:hypothetical protein